jgi:hypothetical protein
MGLAVAIVGGLVVLGIIWMVVSGAALGGSAKAAARQDSPLHPETETLRYRVPDAQDPVVLVTALDRAGYTADLGESAGTKYLTITCPDGREHERARVRSVIAETDRMGLEGPRFNPGAVLFEDEQEAHEHEQ